jgi:hypothetical protein
MKQYIKKAIPVKARLFQEGDEDGFTEDSVPYINTLEGRALQAKFGEHYLVVGGHDDKWLVKKEIFEATYEEIT